MRAMLKTYEPTELLPAIDTTKCSIKVNVLGFFIVSQVVDFVLNSSGFILHRVGEEQILPGTTGELVHGLVGKDRLQRAVAEQVGRSIEPGPKRRTVRACDGAVGKVVDALGVGA